jgi:hypothetical protein
MVDLQNPPGENSPEEIKKNGEPMRPLKRFMSQFEYRVF